MTHLRSTARKLGFISILVVGSWNGLGRAETTSSTRSESGDYEYRFDDEGLLGNTLANSGDIFKGRARFQRVLLLRPRTAFVQHLFKSVEDL